MAKVSSSVAAKGAALDQEVAAASTVVETPAASPDVTMEASIAENAEAAASSDPAMAAAPEPVLDPVAEARGLIDVSLAMLTPFFPSLDAVYTEEKKQRLASVSGPMMQKYGVTAGGIFEKWATDINFTLVALPLAIETFRAIKADQAAKPNAKTEAVAEGGVVPGKAQAEATPPNQPDDIQAPLSMS